MARQFSLPTIILWLFIVMLGIIIGGGLYEARVLVPLWSSDAPSSVVSYYQHNTAAPQFAPDQGGRFWIFATPVGTLLAVATLVSAYWTPGRHRRWRVAAALISLATFVATFAWFVPNIMLLSSASVLTMGADEIARLASLWTTLNWVRAAAMTGAWLAALRALSTPPDINGT